MSDGPGKYDDLCTYVREEANAAGAVVIVINGERGSGFSIQLPVEITPHGLADILERMAVTIRSDGAH